jgi:hypothetical protein
MVAKTGEIGHGHNGVTSSRAQFHVSSPAAGLPARWAKHQTLAI